MNLIGALLALCAAAVALVPRVPVGYPAAAGGAISLAITLSFPLTGRQGGEGTLWLIAEMPALLVLTLLAARAAPKAAVLPALAVALILLREVWSGPPLLMLGACAFWSLGAVVAGGAGLYLRSLDAHRRREVARAVQDQRLALARDLHDFVAHDVTGMLVLAQAVRLAPELPEQVAEALRRIEDGGQRALAVLDRTVHMLDERGGPPSPGIEGLAELAESFPPSVAVSLAVEAVEVPREASATAYRVVSEALTNVRRHAPRASAVGVTVTADGGTVRVMVDDDGGGHSESGRRGGSGLAGLTELLGAVGGSLTAGPHGEGWRVTAVIPA